MDLEHLNKSQIVLLTLLVSFVTSIATGIVSVTLMEQAPPAITQTVNRIVERTVEKVVPESGQVAAAANVVTEKLVTVREDDLISKAVQTVEPSVVRLYGPGRDESGRAMRIFVGLAVVMNEGGGLITDASLPDVDLSALRTDGTEVAVRALPKIPGSPVMHLQAATSTKLMKDGKEETVALSWSPAVFSTAARNLGEAVVSLAGKTSTRVARGIITALSSGEGDSEAVVETDLATDEFAVGSPLVNTDGEVIGLATRTSRETPGGFLASSAVLLDNSKEETKPSQ